MENKTSEKIFLSLKEHFIDLKNIKHFSKENRYCSLTSKVYYCVIINPIELSFSNLKNMVLRFENENERESFLMYLENKLEENNIIIK